MSDAKAQLEALLQQAKSFVAEGRIAEACNRLYDAEAVAYKSGMFTDSAECRKAIGVIRGGKSSEWLQRRDSRATL